jgi:L-alanine-DL-glutamate epimerase-like enolase superfamily enzyme
VAYPKSSYRLQGTFQTHYSAVFVRLHTDEGLVGTGESLVSAAQTETILKRMIGRSPVEYWQDDSIQGVLMAVHDILGQASGMSVARLLSPSPKTRIEHTWWTHCLPPDLMAAEAKLGASLGYRVHKVKARSWQDPLASRGDVRSRAQGIPLLG